MIHLCIHGRRVFLRSASSKPFNLLIQPLLLGRNVSDSAIYRGIRRLDIPKGRARSRRDNGICGEEAGRGGARADRPRRPNHLLGLDAGEVEKKPRRVRVSSRSLKSDSRQRVDGRGNRNPPSRGQSAPPEHSKSTTWHGSSRFRLQRRTFDRRDRVGDSRDRSPPRDRLERSTDGGRYSSDRDSFLARAPDPDRRERTVGHSSDRSPSRDKPSRSTDGYGRFHHGNGKPSAPSRRSLPDKKDKGSWAEEVPNRSSYRTGKNRVPVMGQAPTLGLAPGREAAASKARRTPHKTTHPTKNSTTKWQSRLQPPPPQRQPTPTIPQKKMTSTTQMATCKWSGPQKEQRQTRL